MLRDRRPRARVSLGDPKGAHVVELYHGQDLEHEFFFWPAYFPDWHCNIHGALGNCQNKLTFMERKAIQEAE